MDEFKILKGLDANLPSTKDANSIYHTTDTKRTFIGDTELQNKVINNYEISEEKNDKLRISATDTVEIALGKLEKALLDDEQVLSKTFNSINNACGLDENITFSANTQSNYFKNAENISDALLALDSSVYNDNEKITNKVTAITSTSTDTQYPSAKAIYDNYQNLSQKVYAISSASTDLQYPTAKAVYNAIDTVNNDIKDLDYVTSLGLTDLDDKKIDKDSKVTSISSTSTNEEIPSAKAVYDYVEESSIYATNTTWSELKALRDGNNLVPGMQYRITDYQCTTTQANTQSANHQFDIIVTADDESTLNENARACLHEGDTYFSGAGTNLSAWELKYSIDNDTDRFLWADTTNGKGVIWYIKDEWNNECPYDFKNIQFKRWKASSDTYDNNNIIGTYCLSTKYDGSNGFDDNIFYIEDDTDFVWRYTFHCIYNGDEPKDNSLMTNNDGGCICHDNVIKEAHGDYNNDYYYKKIHLNDIIFCNVYNDNGGNVCICNRIGFGCFNITFGNNCFSNTFGNNCESNTFGNDCFSNTFGNDCYYNTFGNYCRYNTFGNNCYYNTFGNYCYYNTFGNTSSPKSYMRYITLENGVQYTYIDCSATTSSSLYCQNVHVNSGVHGTNSRKRKTLTISTARNEYLTTFGTENDKIILV